MNCFLNVFATVYQFRKEHVPPNEISCTAYLMTRRDGGKNEIVFSQSISHFIDAGVSYRWELQILDH